MGGILFLTNNHITNDLFKWLSDKEPAVQLFSDRLTTEMIKRAKPDMLISYNYRHIIGKDVLEIMAGKAVNLHISLLPWNRGVSPNIFSFLEGTPSGVTIHLIDEGLDTGDILLQEEICFDYEKETLRSAYDKSHEAIQKLFKDNWQAMRSGMIEPRKQTGAGTCHKTADLIKYKDIIDYSDTIAEFLRKAEGLKPLA